MHDSLYQQTINTHTTATFIGAAECRMQSVDGIVLTRERYVCQFLDEDLEVV